MFHVNGTNIKLTRGDSATLSVALDGYTMQEMADTLSIPLGTIKTRLHSARKQLKQILLVEWEETV